MARSRTNAERNMDVGMKCETCKFCAFRIAAGSAMQYECRRHAPVGPYPSKEVMSPFAPVKPDMWCGEWERGEGGNQIPLDRIKARL